MLIGSVSGMKTTFNKIINPSLSQRIKEVWSVGVKKNVNIIGVYKKNYAILLLGKSKIFDFEIYFYILININRYLKAFM